VVRKNTGNGDERREHVDARQLARFFAASNGREALRTLVQADPFGVQARCRRTLRENVYMIDALRLERRAQARLAHDRAHARRAGRLERWVDQTVEASLADLLHEDRCGEAAGTEVREPADARYEGLAARLSLPVRQARRFAVAFNGLGPATRRIVFEVRIRGVAPDECAHRFGWSSSEVREQLQRADGVLARLLREA